MILSMMLPSQSFFPKEKFISFGIVEGKGAAAIVVWIDGNFVPPDNPGILSGVQRLEGIEFELMNGDFDFVATARKSYVQTMSE